MRGTNNISGQSGRSTSLNRFDPKYASFGPRAPRPRPAAAAVSLGTFSAPHGPPAADKYATVRPARKHEPQPLSAAALEYRSLQRPRRANLPAHSTHTAHRRRQDRPERPDRSERPDRPDRPERPERADRPERPERAERPDRSERADRIHPPHQDTRDLYAVTEL